MSESIACKIIGLITELTKTEHKVNMQACTLQFNSVSPYCSTAEPFWKASKAFQLQCSVCNVESYLAGKEIRPPYLFHLLLCNGSIIYKKVDLSRQTGYEKSISLQIVTAGKKRENYALEKMTVI